MSGYLVIDRWTCTDKHGYHELSVIHRTRQGTDVHDMTYYYRPATGSPHWPHKTHHHRAVGLERARELAQEALAAMPIAWVHAVGSADHPIGGQ